MKQEKKEALKRQLDEQVMYKNYIGEATHKQDKKYYDYVVQQSQEFKEKEQREKFEKYLKRKQVEE